MYHVAGSLAHLPITILRPSTPGVPIIELGPHLLHEGRNTAGQCADLPRALLQIVLSSLIRGGSEDVHFFIHAGWFLLSRMQGMARVFSKDRGRKLSCCCV
jgi:hypothetical protein